ncbi:MAG TPA: DNA-processing protein DprA [Solirubrobacteraceae bacterium]|nr:DNA-processing protein DprA [Solirubrobacteraceae bacterium]
MSPGACDACLATTAWLAGAVAEDRRPRRLSHAELAPRARVEDLRCAAHSADVRLLCQHDPAWPAPLRDLDDPPAVLHHAGALDPSSLDGPSVAIVGARRATPYGLSTARGLARELARAGVTVISGLALGIDAAAHAGALDGGGSTVAVLAAGAERASPLTNAPLYRQLLRSGGALSELPVGSDPRPWTFPLRNRVIAALAAVTVVVEAAPRSGSLITAGVARDLGRDVGAVPGRVCDLQARGPNELIVDGAHPIRDAQDVLDLLFGPGAPRPSSDVADPGRDLDDRLAGILACVREGAGTVPALVAEGVDPHDAFVALAELELLGRLRRGPDGRFQVVA